MEHSKGKEIKEEYFNLSMYDLEDGMSINDLRKLIKEYEAKELYWECAGIQEAIEHMSFMTLTLMSKTFNTTQTKLNYDEIKQDTTNRED